VTRLVMDLLVVEYEKPRGVLVVHHHALAQ
jgi:hypothetical protein